MRTHMTYRDVKIKCESCSKATNCSKHKPDCNEYLPETSSNFLASIKIYNDIPNRELAVTVR